MSDQDDYDYKAEQAKAEYADENELHPNCNPHPYAPHGFDRNGSLNEYRYVCDCEGWVPPDEVCNSVSDRHGSAHGLRERLARLLYSQNPIPDDAADDVMTWDEVGENYQACFLKNADEVIAELGLREERDRPYSIRHDWQGDWRTRYVTDWKSDRE